MKQGCLLLVATPIGNLGDISQRAMQALAAADRVVAEDTRHSGILLQHLGIKKPMLSFHEHSERERLERIVSMIERGERIAYVTDAGTPCISDPGRLLVTACHQRGLAIDALPGPSAALCALMLSGIECERFVFEGFLPASGSARKKRLEQVEAQPLTTILFEAPHRIVRTLEDLCDTQAQRYAALCREMTKVHQQIVRGSLESLLEWARQSPPKGEIVLVLEEEKRERTQESIDYTALLRAFLREGVDKKVAAKCVASATNLTKQQVYRQMMDLQK